MALERTGTILDGKYQILRRLAGGGMSEVYLARHLHLDEQRVIKVLRPEDASDPSAQARFLRAARTATQIKHPNVAILYDISGLADGSFYMVWEYIDGEDVGRWVARHGPFPIEIAVDLGIQALRGMEAIHSHGVIHRDISPDNLMLMRDVRGKVRLKIIDLGLVKNLLKNKEIEVTQVGMFMGKLRYCSPEQAGVVEGVVLDRRSDLYSFSAVFYEMLCGKAPYESETPHGFVFKRLTEDPLPLVGRTPGVEIPPELDRIVRKGLERDRDQRFPNAVEFIQALESFKLGSAKFSTREMSLVAPVSAPVQAPAAATPNPDSRSSSQLSRAERDELLAQINRAADRLTRTQKLMEKAQDALTRGERTLAERLVVTIEGIDPKTKGLPELKAQVSELAEKADLERQRLREAEGLLVRYLDQRQAPLAKLALETLRELAPDHANLAVYQQRLAGLSEEARESEEVKREISAIRQALAEGELDRAGQRIARLRAASASAAERLAKELDEARTRQSREREAAELRQRFEDDVASGRLERAEQELSALNQLAASRATLAIYRDQLEEARRLAAQAEQAQPFESRFAAALETGDWQAAREVALAMEKELPGHPRPAALFAEAERLRASSERQQAVHQGVRQIEQLLTQGRADQAELALKVLAKLDPANPRLGYFERRIAALRP